MASVAAAPCLMGPWEYLLGAFISGVGWPGRGFIYTQSSGTDAWSPFCSHGPHRICPLLERTQELGPLDILEPS